MRIRRIGLLTNGGGVPGLNAAIRGAVRTAVDELGVEVIGIHDGFRGLLQEGDSVESLTTARVKGLLPIGGTVLGTSRSDPFHWQDCPGGPVRDRSAELLDRAGRLGIDVLVVMGGLGSLRAAADLAGAGLPVVGIPRTIDNNVALTDASIGHYTAMQTATQAIDKLQTTAESHHRVMVVEVSGQDAGWMALETGVASGAEVILIPEIPYHLEAVLAQVRKKAFSIVVVAEGAVPAPLDDAPGSAGPHAFSVAGALGQIIGERTGKEVRTTVLRYLQSSGSPIALDRTIGTRFGAEAARLAVLGGGRMVSLRAGHVSGVPLNEAVLDVNRVPVDGELVRTAQTVGACLGT